MVHAFDVDLAVRYGVHCAILLNHFMFWTQRNMANREHFYAGRWWTYNSMAAFTALYPDMSKKQVRGALNKLKEEGLIVTGNYNRVQFDRTQWYALTPDGLALFDRNAHSTSQNGTFDGAKRAHEKVPKGHTNTRYNPYTEQQIVDEEDARARGFGTDPEFTAFIQAYEANIGAPPADGFAREKLEADFDILGAEVMIEAVRLTALAYPDNPHTYFGAICREFIAGGVKTLERARENAREVQRKQRGGNQGGKRGEGAGDDREYGVSL